MDALLAERLRRHWPILAAVALFAGYGLVHAVVFRPTESRYRRLLKQAPGMGELFQPGTATATLPPRVYAALVDNSLPSAEAAERAQSGELGSQLLQDMSAAAAKHGLELVVTEPGVVTQQTTGVQVRAHLRMRGRYGAFVALLDELSRGGKLFRVERFSIVPSPDGRHDIELWIERFMLKRNGATP